MPGRGFLTLIDSPRDSTLSFRAGAALDSLIPIRDKGRKVFALFNVGPYLRTSERNSRK